MNASESVSRREFLAMAGAVPFAPALSVLRQRVPIGIELYSVRTELMKDLRGTVSAVAKMGYEIVEFYSPYFEWSPDTAKGIRKLLDDLGIQCRSTHNGGPSFTPDGLKKAIDLNRAIGSKYIIMASPGKVTALDGWKALADRLTSVAEQLRPLGMATGFHNHQSEWRPIADTNDAKGKRPMDIIAAGTPKDVVLQLDVGTCVEAGADPVAWITANPGRIRNIHCKDWSAARGYAVAFGEGDVPWKRLFDAAESTGGVEFYLIEQEESPEGQQLPMAQRCLENYRKMRR
jgi:sugar phosphate isomerase/epimerase